MRKFLVRQARRKRRCCLSVSATSQPSACRFTTCLGVRCNPRAATAILHSAACTLWCNYEGLHTASCPLFGVHNDLHAELPFLEDITSTAARDSASLLLRLSQRPIKLNDPSSFSQGTHFLSSNVEKHLHFTAGDGGCRVCCPEPTLIQHDDLDTRLGQPFTGMRMRSIMADASMHRQCASYASKTPSLLS